MISFSLSFIIYLINGISLLRFYQIKDYLLKRARAHFYLPSSKKLVFNLKEYFLYFLFFLFFLASFFIDFSQFSYRLDFLIFLFTLLFVLRFYFLKKINFTPKAIIISFLSLSINFSFLFLFQNHPLIFFLLSLWLVQFIVFTLSIFIFDFAVKPYLNFLGKKVKEKIEKEKIKVIGLCGSYGKSSTKEILVQLLKEKYKVLTTPPRINHEYALLKFLLKVDLRGYDFLVLEFGSYYLGNIKWVTKFITPEIALITGITKQHLYLFGNIKNIVVGEGTEILSWMKERKLLVNNNHEYWEILKRKIEEEIKGKNIEIFTYGKEADFSYEILEIPTRDKDFQGLTKFLLKTKEKEYALETNLIFPMQIENLVGALALVYLIDNIENFREKIKNIELPEGFLKLKREKNLYIFDDSYNANPRGVWEAISYFKNLNFDYKAIIFNGLFELGKETEEIYKNLAKEFLVFNKIILTAKDYFEIFEEILKDKVLFIKNNKELKLFLQSLNYQKVGIWIFNRFPERLN